MDNDDRVWDEACEHVAMRLMRFKKPKLVAMLAEFGVSLPSKAPKAEIAAAVAEQLLYVTDDEEEVQVVGQTSWSERDAALRAEAVLID